MGVLMNGQCMVRIIRTVTLLPLYQKDIISTVTYSVRCYILHPTWRPSNPIQPIPTPHSLWCYIRLGINYLIDCVNNITANVQKLQKHWNTKIQIDPREVDIAVEILWRGNSLAIVLGTHYYAQCAIVHNCAMYHNCAGNQLLCTIVQSITIVLGTHFCAQLCECHFIIRPAKVWYGISDSS